MTIYRTPDQVTHGTPRRSGQYRDYAAELDAFYGDGTFPAEYQPGTRVHGSGLGACEFKKLGTVLEMSADRRFCSVVFDATPDETVEACYGDVEIVR